MGCITNSIREDDVDTTKKIKVWGLKAFSMIELHCTLALKQTLLHRGLPRKFCQSGSGGWSPPTGTKCGSSEMPAFLLSGLF